MNKLLEALKGIERCCDGNNPDHEQIWHIANDAIKEAESKQCDIHDVSDSTLIKPLSLELSQDIKNHIANLEHIKKLANKIPSMLGIPEKYFD